MTDLVAAVCDFFEEVWNKGNVAAADHFLAADFVSHNSFGYSIVGPADYGRGVVDFRTAFPDLRTTLEDVFASGNRVAVRGRDRGTHQGDFMGLPASGRLMTATWIEIFRVESGKAVEGWLEADSRQMLAQLS